MLNKDDNIFYFEIRLDFINNKVVTKEEVNRVLGSNDEKFVLDDHRLTRLQYKNDKHYNMDTLFNVPQVHKFICKPYYDDIRGDIYTANGDKKAAYTIIRKEIEKFLYENYGRYCNGCELLKTLIID